jgi:hypothetical protein
MNRERRKRIEACVDGLLLLLDLVDGDEDLEDNGDAEPDDSGYGDGDGDGLSVEEHGEVSLGWTQGFNQAGRNWRGDPPWGAVSDGEDGDDNGIADERGINFDDEPDDNGIADDGGRQEQFGALDWQREAVP